MPAGAGIDTKLIQKLKRLVDEFCSYIVKTRALRKVFISVKGIYYQASIMNQDVSWIVPFDFPQKVSLLDLFCLPMLELGFTPS